MHILNSKTGAAYDARTTKSGDMFVSIVCKYEQKPRRRAFVVSRELHSTRSQAYRRAVRLCKTLAASCGDNY